jgi:hypothetical protein
MPAHLSHDANIEAGLQRLLIRRLRHPTLLARRPHRESARKASKTMVFAFIQIPCEPAHQNPLPASRWCACRVAACPCGRGSAARSRLPGRKHRALSKAHPEMGDVKKESDGMAVLPVPRNPWRSVQRPAGRNLA